MNEISFEQILDFLTQSNGILSSLSSILGTVADIIGVGVAVVGVVVAAIGAFIAFIKFVVLWIVEAIPIFAISKKLGRKSAWLAWVPVLGSMFRLWVIADMAGDKPFTIFKNKITLKNRATSFWIYIGITYLGSAVIYVVVAVLSSAIPIIGSISGILTLLPTIACALMEYVYFRDVLEIFKEDKKNNLIVAIIVTALDTLLTMGLARAIYLYGLMKSQPLPTELYVKASAETAVYDY